MHSFQFSIVHVCVWHAYSCPGPLPFHPSTALGDVPDKMSQLMLPEETTIKITLTLEGVHLEDSRGVASLLSDNQICGVSLPFVDVEPGKTEAPFFCLSPRLFLFFRSYVQYFVSNTFTEFLNSTTFCLWT